MDKGTAPGSARPCFVTMPVELEEEGATMAALAATIHLVVGVDVAKRRHVPCVLDAATGAVRQKGVGIEATAEGYLRSQKQL